MDDFFKNADEVLKTEPEVLTPLDIARILRIGKNKAYALIKSGKLNSIKIGGKVIVPKICLINYLMDTKSYQFVPRTVPSNHWTCEQFCGIINTADGNSGRKQKISSTVTH